MRKHSVSFLGLIYLLVGIVIAVGRGYVNLGLLRGVGSALLCIFLWWLPLLGVNLHIS